MALRRFLYFLAAIVAARILFAPVHTDDRDPDLAGMIRYACPACGSRDTCDGSDPSRGRYGFGCNQCGCFFGVYHR